MQQSVTIRRTLLTLSGLLLVVSACGGGSSALSKEEFLKRGNAICDSTNKVIDAASKTAFPNSGAQPDAATIKKFVNETVAPTLKKSIDDIDALKPPKDLQGGVDKMVADARAALTKLQQQAETDPTSVFNGADPFADVNKD